MSLGKLLWEGRHYHYPQILCVGDVCSVKTEVGLLNTRAFPEKANPRSRGQRFPQWFQTLSQGKLLWEGRFYHYPQILRTGDVCAVKTDLVITRKPCQVENVYKPVYFAVVSNTELGKVTMGTKNLKFSASILSDSLVLRRSPHINRSSATLAPKARCCFSAPYIFIRFSYICPTARDIPD